MLLVLLAQVGLNLSLRVGVALDLLAAGGLLLHHHQVADRGTWRLLVGVAADDGWLSAAAFHFLHLLVLA